jgi:mycothiol system anti-sigma-R factor
VSCGDVQKFVHPYLDGEFEDQDRVELEQHLQTCATCREMVAFEQSFKTALKKRVKRPAAPPELRARVLEALDRADAAGDGPVPRLWRRVVPAGVVVAAAAAAAFFLWPVAPNTDPALAEDAIRTHEKDLPVEVAGDEEQVRAFFTGRVPVPVKPPRLQSGAALVGARIGRLRDHDAAQIRYRVNQSPVTLYVFDASSLGDMDGWDRRVVQDHEVFTRGSRGYNVVLYQDAGVGYAFTSDLDQAQMLELVSGSFPVGH